MLHESSRVHCAILLLRMVWAFGSLRFHMPLEHVVHISKVESRNNDILNCVNILAGTGTQYGPCLSAHNTYVATVRFGNVCSH